MSKGSSDVEMPKPEDYLPLIEQSAAINRVDQNTPYGSVKYNTTYNEPLGYDDWYAGQDQSIFTTPQSTSGGYDPNHPSGIGKAQWMQNGYGATRYGGNQGQAADPQSMYNDYVSNFDRGVGHTTAEHTFSPEVQSLWDKQWTPDSYQNYSDDYMDRYSELMQPDRDYAYDRFEQNMFDRGQPVGGEEYGAKYRQTIGDPNARADTMAAGQAANAADMARLQDYNRLATAMGLSTLPVPQIDTMGAANMAMNADITNAQNAQQGNSSLWNALGMMGGGYLMGPGGASLFG